MGELKTLPSFLEAEEGSEMMEREKRIHQCHQCLKVYSVYVAQCELCGSRDIRSIIIPHVIIKGRKITRHVLCGDPNLQPC